jgi:hypothetical protein
MTKWYIVFHIENNHSQYCIVTAATEITIITFEVTLLSAANAKL